MAKLFERLAEARSEFKVGDQVTGRYGHATGDQVIGGYRHQPQTTGHGCFRGVITRFDRESGIADVCWYDVEDHCQGVYVERAENLVLLGSASAKPFRYTVAQHAEKVERECTPQFQSQEDFLAFKAKAEMPQYHEFVTALPEGEKKDWLQSQLDLYAKTRAKIEMTTGKESITLDEYRNGRRVSAAEYQASVCASPHGPIEVVPDVGHGEPFPVPEDDGNPEASMNEYRASVEPPTGKPDCTCSKEQVVNRGCICGGK